MPVSTALKPPRDFRAPNSLVFSWTAVLQFGHVLNLEEPQASEQQKQCPHGTSAWSATWFRV